MHPLEHSSCHTILQLIDRGEFTSRQVTQYFIDRIREVNPELNAVVINLFEEALQEADQIDDLFKEGKRKGRLHGLPLTVKECLDLQGTPSTFGLVRRKNDIPSSTDPYIHALQKEGAIIIGKTNVAQLLLSFESANRVYGVTNNPHSQTHTAGGSSGGEGAIIAAGASPAGLGTDIGGSVRIPAAFCGICSIKPTMQRMVDMARFVDDPQPISIQSVTGVLGNSANDLQLLLEVINEAAKKMRKVTPLQHFKDVNVATLKVGYFVTDGLFEPMPAIKRAVLQAVKVLREAGIEVVEFIPPKLSEAEELLFKILSADRGFLFTDNLQDEKAIPQAAGLIMLAKASVLVRKVLWGLAGLLGQKSLRRIIPYFGGKGIAFRNSVEAQQREFISKFLGAMDHSPIGKLDAIISPVCALPAYLHNTADKVGLGGIYTGVHNVTGFPAGVATITKVQRDEAIGRKATVDLLQKTASKIEAASQGLPLAVQIAARPWNEQIVIALINLLHKRQLS